MKTCNRNILLIFTLVAILCCSMEIVSAQDSCYQKADPGNCRASIPRFYFDSQTGRCNNFLYGGCGGNENNFRSLQDCFSFRNYCLRRRG